MWWKTILGAALAGATALWIGNTTLFAEFPQDQPLRLIAHRGQHQLFDRDGIERDTCTADRMLAPTHSFLENTIPSMRAAFAAGADIVELDIHLTPDKRFAVFHDWTLDCRTNVAGVTEETPMDVLKTLDIGHGYTADGGRTYPFRGQGVGMMPTLPEVFEAFPGHRFLINFKSRRAEEGAALAEMLNTAPPFREATFAVYGGNEPTITAAENVPDLPGIAASGMKQCLLDYLMLGWSGHVPQACRNGYVMVPANYAFLLWGWPERFYQRIRAAGSDVILLGPYAAGDPGTTGLDKAEDWDLVPDGYPGLAWTNRIEQAAAELARRGFCTGTNAPGACRTAAVTDR